MAYVWAAQSFLADFLLEYWGLGLLTAKLVIDICNMSVKDGCENPLVVKLSKCGSSGESSHGHRDLSRLCGDALELAEPFEVPCKFVNDKDELIDGIMPIVALHEELHLMQERLSPLETEL